MTEDKPRLQCKKCPWKVSTNPHDIPDGYCETKHRGLSSTISKPSSVEGLFSKSLKIMACHETPVGEELFCVGWFDNQIGPGNNLGLRMAVMSGKLNPNVETVGKQHDSFEETIK